MKLKTKSLHKLTVRKTSEKLLQWLLNAQWQQRLQAKLNVLPTKPALQSPPAHRTAQCTTLSQGQHQTPTA